MDQNATRPMTPLATFVRTLTVTAMLAIGTGTTLAAGAVDVKQGAALQSQGALLIDVRTPGEFVQGHAPGATLIPLDQLQQRLGELRGAHDQPIALICRSGNRSGQAQVILEKAGFTKAVNVEGGMIAWARAGLPVVTGAQSK